MFAVFIALFCSFACGAKVNTGRNGNPVQQDKGEALAPKAEGSKDAPKGPTTTTTTTSPDPTPRPGESPGTSLPPSNDALAPGADCFAVQAPSLPAALAEICVNTIGPNALMSKVHKYLCSDRLLIGVVQQPSCGWKGDKSNIMSFNRVYEREPESSGNDYEDVHATMVHGPGPLDKSLEILRLVFENYAEFRSKGYLWASGTRENANLNGGKLLTGVDFRFRAEKDVYEIGYNGHAQLHKLDDKTWIQVTYADSNFSRITKFAQIVLYSAQSDGTMMSIKLEHKALASKGLYKRALAGSLDAMQDGMIRFFENMTR